MKILAGAGNRSRGYWALAGVVLIAIVGLVDYATGLELSLSLFYLFPLGMVTWFAGRRLGFAAALLSSVAWVLADLGPSAPRSPQLLLLIWNAAIALGFFIVVACLIAEVRRLLEHEQSLARTDYLTGATSAGHFYVLLQDEIKRSARYKHPFAVAHFDIDGFKDLNDRCGHSTGDQVLRSIVTRLREQLRCSDVVARLGGDEFAILLPDTDQLATSSAVAKIQRELRQLMSTRGLPITFSIGAVTFNSAAVTPDKAVGMADQMMYQVKNAGKDGMRCSVYNG